MDKCNCLFNCPHIRKKKPKKLKLHQIFEGIRKPKKVNKINKKTTK